MNNGGDVASGRFDTCTIKDVDAMFGSHVRAVFTIIKRAMPHLKKSQGMNLFKMVTQLINTVSHLFEVLR